MSAGLIKHLKKKTEEDANTSILMLQWNFGEKLVGKLLENCRSHFLYIVVIAYATHS